MDQSRAINALAPFIALAKSANSPRAAADLITQATSANNTYVFAELLQQPNVQALAGQEQYGSYFTLLQIFAWGTWESYKATPDLPALSDSQALKLRLLSLLTIASRKTHNSTQADTLSYRSLVAALDLASIIDLEHLFTTAIYNDVLTGTLNPELQIAVVTSVAPLRDLAPGSVQNMVAELEEWSGRCNSVLADLEEEISNVKSNADKRAKREARVENQIRVVTEDTVKSADAIGAARSGHNTRGATKRDPADADYVDDAMDIDGGGGGFSSGGRKKSASGLLRGFVGANKR